MINARGGLLTYADVMTYYGNPVVPLMEGAFLVLVVTHAILGMRGIVLDMSPAPAIVRGLTCPSAAPGFW